jgi:hypothetical protein
LFLNYCLLQSKQASKQASMADQSAPKPDAPATSEKPQPKQTNPKDSKPKEKKHKEKKAAVPVESTLLFACNWL